MGRFGGVRFGTARSMGAGLCAGSVLQNGCPRGAQLVRHHAHGRAGMIAADYEARHLELERAATVAAGRPLRDDFDVCADRQRLAAGKADTGQADVIGCSPPGQGRGVSWRHPVTDGEGQRIPLRLPALLPSSTIHIDLRSTPSALHARKKGAPLPHAVHAGGRQGHCVPQPPSQGRPAQ